MKVLERSFPKCKQTQVHCGASTQIEQRRQRCAGLRSQVTPNESNANTKDSCFTKTKNGLKLTISLSHVSLLTFDGSQLTGFGVTPLVDLGGGSRLFSWKLGRFGGGAWGNICSFRWGIDTRG